MAGSNNALNLFARRFKTGERVPVSGIYVDQDGVSSRHEEHGTFPPTVRTSTRKGGECAFRYLVTVQ